MKSTVGLQSFSKTLWARYPKRGSDKNYVVYNTLQYTETQYYRVPLPRAWILLSLKFHCDTVKVFEKDYHLPNSGIVKLPKSLLIYTSNAYPGQCTH